MLARTPLVIALTIAWFPLTSCDRQVVEPDFGVVAADQDPLSNFLNGPAAPGPHVIRFQDDFVVVYLDPKRSLLAVIGADTDEVCQGVFDFGIVSIQEHFPPGDATRIMELIHGDDLSASVWEFAGTGGCALFTTATPLVKGPVDLRLTDNDLLVFLDPDNKNANAFGFSVHGAFNGHSRCRWDGNDSATIKCSDVIIVK